MTRWRWLSKPKSDCAMAGERTLAGHQETFSRTFTRTFEYPLNSNSGLTLVIM